MMLYLMGCHPPFFPRPARVDCLPFFKPAPHKIAGNERYRVLYRSGAHFRPQYLVVPPSVSQAFNIESLATWPEPMKSMPPLRTHPESHAKAGTVWRFSGECPEIPANKDICISVHNTTEWPAVFYAELWGQLRAPW